MKIALRGGWRAAPLVALLLGLLAINIVAIWEIVAARREARRAAASELELRTTAHGRALEALLANLRGDISFLLDVPPLAELAAEGGSLDPMASRWRRLDAESALLLFLQGHPALHALAVRDTAGRPLVVVGRRAGAPLVLPAEEAMAEAATAGLARGAWPLGRNGARLEAWVDPGRLLDLMEAAAGDALRLHLAAPTSSSGSGGPAAVVPVADAHWQPPLAWWLEGRAGESPLERSVAALAGRYRATVLLNLAVIAATVLVGLLALRQARQRAAAETAAAREREVRELERRLAASERLASVGRMAAGIAHEVNNPLEGMTNFLALLESELAAGRPEAAARHAGRVREGLARAAAIVRQVLAFSDPARAPKEIVDLRRSVREAADFLARQFREVEIVVAGGEGGLAARGNPVGLGQLFFNLLLNSCQVQEGGGRIEVELERAGEEALIRIADRGPGLAPEALDHLFEPFSSTRGSSGLGLAVCHGIVRDHGGSIAGRNRPGGGAEFEVRLPLAPDLPRSEVPATSVPEGAGTTPSGGGNA